MPLSPSSRTLPGVSTKPALDWALIFRGLPQSLR
jgi:hypothetical protein